MEEKVEIILTKRGMIIFGAVLVALDLLSSLFIAKASTLLFLEYELNFFLKALFMQFGWVAFTVYPILPFLIYAGFINLGFLLFKRGSISKHYFIGLYLFYGLHIFAIASNLLIFWQIENLK